MNLQYSLASAGCLAIAGAFTVVAPAAAQVGEPAPVEAIAPPVEVEVTEAVEPAVEVEVEEAEPIVPEGEPMAISDWALAGIVWSDAHLVRKLAQAAAEEADTSLRHQKMMLLVSDCEDLIASLETFGWRRIAVEEAEREAIEAEVEVAAPAVIVPDTPGVDVDVVVPAGTISKTDDEVVIDARPFTFRRYAVEDYLNEPEVGIETPAEAVEEGVEEAIAAGANEVTSGFEAQEGEGVGPDARRQAQTQSSTLPYSFDSIYERDDIHPNAGYPERPAAVVAGVGRDLPPVTTLRPAIEPAVPNVETDELLDTLAVAPVPAGYEIDIRRYTDRADRFKEDADWVKFRLRANQQRWWMLRNRGDDESIPELSEHLNAALLQLRADAATALAASKDPELAEVLEVIVE